MWFIFPIQLPVPTEVVSALSVPRTDSIQFHPLVAMGNHQSEEALAGLAENVKFPVHNVPFFFHLYHIHSSFVEVCLHVISTRVHFRGVLPLAPHLIWGCPPLNFHKILCFSLQLSWTLLCCRGSRGSTSLSTLKCSLSPRFSGMEVREYYRQILSCVVSKLDHENF